MAIGSLFLWATVGPRSYERSDLVLAQVNYHFIREDAKNVLRRDKTLSSHLLGGGGDYLLF